MFDTDQEQLLFFKKSGATGDIRTDGVGVKINHLYESQTVLKVIFLTFHLDVSNSLLTDTHRWGCQRPPKVVVVLFLSF